MTLYEHAMLGANLALVCGCRRRHGWGLPATAAAAGALPDWDGLSLLFGPSAYTAVHRVWGHNLLVAGVTGCALGAVGYFSHLSTQFRRALPAISTETFSASALMTWMLVSLVAGISHVPCDAIFSGAPAANWPVQALWPFSHAGWAFPLVPWGDLGATVIFIVEMFTLYCWPRFSSLIALAALMSLAGYIALRWYLIPTPPEIRLILTLVPP